jgi:DNA helicase II / ATP-dependent DNA helicase PcrA
LRAKKFNIGSGVRSSASVWLLAYPHFIDTIHGFMNRFLALPWLASNGFPTPTIDNDVTTAFRRGVLAAADYFRVQSFLKKKYGDFDRIRIPLAT